MNEYHLQARRAVDSTGPRREQTRLVDADNFDTAARIAGELAGRRLPSVDLQRGARREVTAVTHRLRLLRTVNPGPPIPPPPHSVGIEVASLHRRR